MTIKDFMAGYEKNGSESLKDKYIKEKVKVKTYLPFLEKVAVAQMLAKHTTLDKETGNIKVDSCTNYLLFYRVIIENYTNLEVIDDKFYEDYDLLNRSGALVKIMQMIPESEIKEFKMFCDMKQSDIMTNKGNVYSFVSEQVTRFGTLTGVTLKPILDSIAEAAESIDEKTVIKNRKTLKNFFKRNK